MNKKKKKTSRVVKDHKKVEKTKQKRFSILGFLLKILIVFIIIFSGIFGIFYLKEGCNSKKAIGSMISSLGGNTSQVTVLILGVSTDISTQLADTIMVCSYNPSSQKAYFLSIPRDTFIGKNQSIAKGKDKINSLYSREGAIGMKNKVQELLGIKIDYYAVVNTGGLVELVDAIGGVNYEVPINMNYDDITQNLHIHLDSGMQKIDGEKAEQLLRFRHNNDGSSYPSSYGDNDFGRMRTQREFMKVTIKQTAKIHNIFKLPKIMRAVSKNLDTDMKIGKIVNYALCTLGFEVDSLETYQLPGESKLCNSVWIYLVNQSEKEQLINELNQKIKN